MRISILSIFFALIFITSCNTGSDKKKALSGQDTLQAAITALSEQIADDESNHALYNERANLYMEDRQFDAALKDINKAVSLAPKVSSYYVTLSDIYLMMGNPENAGEALTNALKIDPSDNVALLRIAKLNLIIREYKTAMEYVKKSLEAEPVNNPGAFFIQANIRLETGDTVGAVNDLKKSVSLDQNNFEAFMQLGELYSMLKDPLAADYYNNALRIKPESKDALYLLGMFYQEKGNYDQAMQMYQKLEKVDTVFKNASYNQGYICLVYLKDFPQAVKHFSDAIAKDPLYTEAWYNRGYAYELSGDYANARKDYKRSLEITTNYPRAIEALNRIDKAGK